jgi:outer membrane protein assembly factor BamA
MIRKIYMRALLPAGALLFASCSTTLNLPQGETLYTGIKEIEISADTLLPGTLEEVEAALAYPPNNALFGSSSIRTPLPIGLWIYNALVNKRGGFWRWMFDKFAARPVLITTVNPEVRTAIARNVLRENGYFNPGISFAVTPGKNKRTASITYRVDMNHLYTYDSIRYIRTRSKADSLLLRHEHRQSLRRGAHFSVSALEAERQRTSSLLRGHGFYFHRPEYIVYQADTLAAEGKVWLRVSRKPGMPLQALVPYHIGRRSLSIYGYNNEEPTDSVTYKDLLIRYQGKLRLRPPVVYERLMLSTGDLYSEERQTMTRAALSNLSTLRYTDISFERRDSSLRNDTIDMSITASYDLPLDGELELNVTDKSNSLRGPGAVFSLTRRNIFRGGEALRLQANGSYEWQTDGTGLNSYEAGASATLSLPFVMLPGFAHRGLAYPSGTSLRVYADLLNRARFFRILSFGGGVSYEFQPSPVHRHSFSPFRLTYNRLQSTTEEFDSIAALNPILFMSLDNQFVPALSYTYTYDDSSLPRRHHLWWEASITEASNLLSAVYALAGHRWDATGKELLDNPFAQFVKATAEVRYNYRIDRNNRVVMRLMTGAIVSYGNARVSPFSEQFYVGGANSLRAFTIRTVGPGRFKPADPTVNRYSYIDQTGDIKLEANLEYRFRIIGSLYGATFLDWGGLWLVRPDAGRPGGSFSLKHAFTDMALGTGAGLRYDMDFLVVRFDLGIPLHLPYDTGKPTYFNLNPLKSPPAFHLAVGYPF